MRIIDLCGSWDFRLDKEKVGIENKYYEMELEDQIILPATVSTARKGNPSVEVNTGYLTDPYLFEGYTWYSKELDIVPGEGNELFLVMERTRISHVWINSEYLGSKQSLCTSHRYQLTPYITGKCKITIMIDNTSYPVRGGHMTSPDTQTNWNGITGRIYLEECSTLALTEIKIYPEVTKRQIEVKSRLERGRSCIVAVKVSDEDKVFPLREYLLQEGDNTFLYELDETAITWSEHNPHLYHLQLFLLGVDEIQREEYDLIFGLREFKAVDKYFTINKKRTFLRGKHDGMIFPMTGHAPTELESWIRVMATAKEYGINHYRFHTCCPPEAAFAAADRLGIYMEPELPFWGTITEEGEENHDGVAQQFLIDEGFRILDEFGNHPSFVMFSLGNELWGSKNRLNQILGDYRSYDSRHLYTQGSNNFQFVPCILENEDFFCGVRFSRERLFRGSYAMCDAPLGHIQTSRPDSCYNYDQMIRPSLLSGEVTREKEVTIQYGTGTKTVRAGAEEELIPHIPVVSHEIGQYAMYPDFLEIEKYTGVLKARNLEVFRKRLAEKNLLPMAERFFRASGRFAAECYKTEIETAYRSKELAGFQLLDLQDFTGQGTALVGILNSFMESKGIISGREWSQFCGDTVLLPELPGMIHSTGEALKLGIKLVVFSAEPLLNPVVELTLTDGADILLQHQNTESGEYWSGVYQLSDFMIRLPEAEVPKELTVTVSLSGTEIKNSETLWLYPKKLPYEDSASESTPTIGGKDKRILITDNVTKAREALQQGEKVLLYLVQGNENNSISGTYCTDFWCYPMFRSISESMGKPVPVGTHGLLINKEHPIFEYFPTREYTTAQWYDIIENSRTWILDQYPLEPIVWTIDNIERNHRLGNLFELKSGSGKLFLCSADLRKLTDSIPARWLEYSILRYMNSQHFEPVVELEGQELSSLLS